MTAPSFTFVLSDKTTGRAWRWDYNLQLPRDDGLLPQSPSEGHRVGPPWRAHTTTTDLLDRGIVGIWVPVTLSG